MSKRDGFLVWACLSGAFMLIGSFGAWVKVGAMSVSGTDGSNDGWAVVIVAALGLLLLFLGRRHRAAGLWPLLAGLAGAATTVHDRSNVQDKIHQGGALVQALATIGWGLNVAMIASFSLLIAGIAWLIQVSNESPAETPHAPQAPYKRGTPLPEGSRYGPVR